MSDYLTRITHDLFDVAVRLKEIDGGYYPVYNHTKNRYEIHHEGRRESLQLVLPYDTLDVRAIKRVKETRLEYVENMLKDIDRQNDALEAKRMQSQSTARQEILREFTR